MSSTTIIREAAQAALASAASGAGRRRRQARRDRRRRRDPQGRRGGGEGRPSGDAAVTATIAPAPSASGAQGPAAAGEARSAGTTLGLVLGVLVVWIVLWSLTRGTNTLELPGREHTDLHDSLTGFRDSVLAGRDTNPLIQLTTTIADGFRAAFDWLQRMVSIPDFPRPVPQIGWLGVTAMATWIGLAVANWRIALLIAGTFVSFGLLGFWTDSIDLLLVTGRVGRCSSYSSGCRSRCWSASARRWRTPDHRGPRPDADDAHLRLPDPDRAVLRHRRLRGNRLHPHLRATAADPHRRLRHQRSVRDHDRGH